ncbi:MAG: SDR family oxidoreductase [Ilumatobacteraceae bacterium]
MNTSGRAAHLVTGATGFVGGAIVLELLERTSDDVLCLVRADCEQDGQARLVSTLTRAALAYDRLDLVDAIGARCRAVIGDIRRPRCGLEMAPCPELDVRHIWHAAASLKYEDRHATEVTAANVDGTRHVIELATALGSPVLTHISTAYVAGTDTGEIPELLRDGTSHTNNVYEQTKVLAERAVAEWSGPWQIVRPSVVVGHSLTGGSTSSFGLYGAAAAVLAFKRTVERRLGSLLNHRGVPVVADPNIEMNLIPIDTVATNTVTIGLTGPRGIAYHVTNAAAPPLGTVMLEVFRWAGLAAPRFVPDRRHLNGIDEKFDEYCQFYLSYVVNGKRFDRTNTDVVCGADASHRPMDAATVRWHLDTYQASRPLGRGRARILKEAG